MRMMSFVFFVLVGMGFAGLIVRILMNKDGGLVARIEKIDGLEKIISSQTDELTAQAKALAHSASLLEKAQRAPSASAAASASAASSAKMASPVVASAPSSTQLQDKQTWERHAHSDCPYVDISPFPACEKSAKTVEEAKACCAKTVGCGGFAWCPANREWGVLKRAGCIPITKPSTKCDLHLLTGDPGELSKSNVGQESLVTLPSPPSTPPPLASCREIRSDKIEVGDLTDVGIIQGSQHVEIGIRTKFILYVPDGFATPPNATIVRLRSVLFANPSVDAVGANTIRENVFTQHCHHIELCHWTLLLHFEYSCSVGPFMQCDSTSPIFMTRKRHAALLQEVDGAFAPLSFFVKLKRSGAMVLTDTSVTIDEGPEPILTASVAQKLAFVRLHAVDEIRNRDNDQVTSLCTNQTCDAKIVKTVLRGKSWAKTGISMPIFAYKAYVSALQSAVRFLNSNNVKYYVDAGAALGFFKMGRLLPWDAGDVDIIVDSEQFDCSKWMSMVKTWADKFHFIHPHRNPAGAKCDHYGVYAMPRSQHDGQTTDVGDPWSIGLITFSRKRVTKRLSSIRVHGIEAHVPSDLWGHLNAKYHNVVLEHATHARTAHRCTVPLPQKHNCLIDTTGTHLDTCMEFTQFGRTWP